PRLTAWPRPSRAREASYKTLSVADLSFTDNSSTPPPETAAGNGLGPALVLAAAHGPGDERLCAVTGQRFNGAFRGLAAPEEPEDGRAAARHGGGGRAEVAKLLLERADLLVPPQDRRLQIIDHLGRARRPGDRQELEFAGLAQPRGPILVVPGVGLRRGDAERRTNDHHEVRRQIDERIDFFAAAEPQRGAAGEKERHVGADRR